MFRRDEARSNIAVSTSTNGRLAYEEKSPMIEVDVPPVLSFKLWRKFVVSKVSLELCDLIAVLQMAMSLRHQQQGKSSMKMETPRLT